MGCRRQKTGGEKSTGRAAKGSVTSSSHSLTRGALGWMRGGMRNLRRRRRGVGSSTEEWRLSIVNLARIGWEIQWRARGDVEYAGWWSVCELSGDVARLFYYMT